MSLKDSWHAMANELRQRPIFLGAILVLGVLILYAPVSHHGFLRWDDDQYVTSNPHVSTGLTAQNITWAFLETGTFYWHPLAWLSHMLDCQLFGSSPGPHHLVNVLLHALNVLLLFMLLQQSTGSLWRSSLVAALFAFHPINVETVAWIAERKSLLSLLFSLLTVSAYGWYVRQPKPKRYCVVMVTFLLALMSKPMAVTLPCVLLLLDYWPLNRAQEPSNSRTWARLAIEKVPLLLMSAGSAALTIVGQRSAGAMSSVSTLPIGMRIEQALVCFGVYLRKLFWPADLAAFYPYHPHWLGWGQVLAAVILITSVTALVLRSTRRAPYLLTGWLSFVVTLIPVVGIVQVGRVVIADRFAYLPAIGVFLFLVWLCGDIVEGFRLWQLLPAIASAALLVAVLGASRYYIPFWQDGVQLFSRAADIEKVPDSMIEHLIADSLVAAHRVDDALEHYQRSCDLDPRFDLCHYNIAEIMFSRYDVRSALEHYQLAGKYTTSRTLALNCLVNSGEALFTLGDLDGAERQLGYALSVDPNNNAARHLLAQVHSLRGRR